MWVIVVFIIFKTVHSNYSAERYAFILSVYTIHCVFSLNIGAMFFISFFRFTSIINTKFMFCVTGEVKMYSIKLKAVRWNLDQKIHYYITRHIYFQV